MSSEFRTLLEMREMTQLIAMMAGPYLLVTGVGFLLSTRFYERMVAGNEDTDPVALNLSGMVHFLIGLLISVQHFRWGSVPEAIVTLIGVAALLKGAFLIVAPGMMLKSPKTSRAMLRLSGAAFVMLGGYLAYFGFIKTVAES